MAKFDVRELQASLSPLDGHRTECTRGLCMGDWRRLVLPGCLQCPQGRSRSPRWDEKQAVRALIGRRGNSRIRLGRSSTRPHLTPKPRGDFGRRFPAWRPDARGIHVTFRRGNCHLAGPLQPNRCRPQLASHVFCASSVVGDRLSFFEVGLGAAFGGQPSALVRVAGANPVAPVGWCPVADCYLTK